MQKANFFGARARPTRRKLSLLVEGGKRGYHERWPVRKPEGLGRRKKVAAMSEQDRSVSEWIEECKWGDDEAAARLWERYFQRLVGLARKRLQVLRRRVAVDEEDVALSAFQAFLAAAREDRYPDLQDRDSLWSVLVTFTYRKAKDLIAKEMAAKRGGGRTGGDSALGPAGDTSSGLQGLDAVADPGPTPDMAAEMAELFQRFLDSVEDERMLEAAMLKMDGHGSEAIAEQLEVSPATVRRWLALLRGMLKEQCGDRPTGAGQP
jgi:DNA-directed RNA polymerase specialized sigma24 family protein